MRLDPKKKKTIFLTVFSVLILILLVVLVKSPFFKGIRDTITGSIVNTIGDGKAVGPNSKTGLEAPVIKTISIYTDMYTEDFQIPISNLDMTIEAEEVDIITPSTDITINLEGPMVFEALTGTLNWENSIFTLEGQLNKYLGNPIKINWKTAENVKIRVKKGKASISQINIASFGSVVSGEVKLANKVTLSPNKDLVTLKGFRGSLTSVVEDVQTKLVFDGVINTVFLGSQEFELNID